MSINKYFLPLQLSLIVFILFSCENLEDTYKDYSGDGKIKYVGSNKSFDVKVGWERFVFNWEKSPDLNVKDIVIEWSSNEDNGKFVIPAEKSSFETEAIFKCIPYAFECYSVDEKGNKSMSKIKYAKPYSDNHELVMGFPKMINKFAFIENRAGNNDLVIFFDPYNENIKSVSLSYYKSGALQTTYFLKEDFEKRYIVIEDVDKDGELSVNIEAEVEGCIDIVKFKPNYLDINNRTLNYDVAQELMAKHNLSVITNEFMDTLKVLELDYDIKSMEDVLLFPNLEKLILGGNRFTQGSRTLTLSSLNDIEKSIFAINIARKSRGLEVIIHNNHYNIQDSIPYAIKKGHPVLPVLNYLDTKEWTITSSSNEGDENNDPAKPENLLDNNYKTLWAPKPVQNYLRTHYLEIDMKSMQTISGFKISQTVWRFDLSAEQYPNVIRIMLSDNGIVWEQAFLQVQSIIGSNIEESTILKLPQAIKTKFIRIIVTDGPDKTNRGNIALGDIVVF